MSYSSPMPRWIDPKPVQIPGSFADLNLHPLVLQTLIRRGMTTIESAQEFLHPESIESNPFPGIERSIDIINMAIRKGGRICVWGDFDVDGQTSTALLVQTLRALGADTEWYIPIRGREGHGVHVQSLKPILENGAQLVVTCDTGITAHTAIEFARERGVKVVITDHHDPGEVLPDAAAIINPKLLTRDHPLRNLAGVGVAYKLAEALLEQAPSDVANNLDLKELLDLVALGLIADVSLLRGETRALARQGIIHLRNTNRLGLKVMAELAGTTLETLTEETIGFTFAPRLNALGRLSDANPAVELLLTRDPVRARVLAAQIEGLNAQRRLLTSQVYQAAEAQLREKPGLLSEPAIVLSNPNWPGGVVGIVANRLVERYHKPALLLTESEDGILRGSARSVDGLHITEAISTQKDLLIGFGGHPMAAGLSMPAVKFQEFKKGLGRAIELQMGEDIHVEPALQIDAWLSLDEINLDLAQALESLAPFGAGNPGLILATRNLSLKSVKEIGKTREHLRMVVTDEQGYEQDLLWWNGAGESIPDPEIKFDLAYSLRASTYRDQRQVAVQFEALRVVEEKPAGIRKPPIDIRDMRGQSSILNLQPSTLIWAEGPDKAIGISRHELHPADELSIYTSPPSQAELGRALEIVQPKTVYVFANSPAELTTEEFLSHLAGLCKYVLNRRQGEVILRELTAAMAARESAVLIGLEWLAAGGQLSVKIDRDQVILMKGKQEKNSYLQAELFLALRGILEETAAYRKYLATIEDLARVFN